MCRVGVEPNASILRAEIRAAVCPRAAAAVAGGLAEHHVFREVLVKRSQPVTYPRAYGRMGAFAYMPPGLKRQLRAVIVIERPE